MDPILRIISDPTILQVSCWYGVNNAIQVTQEQGVYGVMSAHPQAKPPTFSPCILRRRIAYDTSEKISPSFVGTVRQGYGFVHAKAVEKPIPLFLAVDRHEHQPLGSQKAVRRHPGICTWSGMPLVFFPFCPPCLPHGNLIEPILHLAVAEHRLQKIRPR